VSITVGVPALEQNALLYVAADRGMFAPQRIAVTIKDFGTGPEAIAAMMSGAVDIAETAEFPFVAGTMSGKKMRILTANDRFENDYLVARNDRGISGVSALRGKRIGVTRNAITEFYLGRFLTLNGIHRDEVTLVNVPPVDFVTTLLDGLVDAIVAWQPFVSRMTSAAPAALTVWPVQSGQAVYGILVCQQAWLDTHKDAARGFLVALAAAEDFVARRPADARTIVAKRLSYEDSYLSAVWPNHGFSLTLDVSLLTAMEDEARWLLANHLSSSTEIPDFGALIYRDGLNAARPEGLNLMQ
jgi:ABC-type nitrate/sulfonate/bicarbonate transport system substrate-binding protein